MSNNSNYNLKPLLDNIRRETTLHDLIVRLTSRYPHVYLVGGAVRDFLLSRDYKDYDLVIEKADKKEVYDYISSLPGKLVDIQSRNFGVFKYRPPNSKMIIDIALPRVDVYQQYFLGHANVTTVTHKDLSIIDDLSRRDFTINSLAIDLSSEKLIDPFGGQKDLKNKIIRAVGDPYERLVKEDPTRMLRALRFACQLNFDIDLDTYKTIKKHQDQIARKFTIKDQAGKSQTQTRVAVEMLAAEFLKGFDAYPEKMIELLDDTKIYRSILTPELISAWEGLKTTEQPPDFHAEGNVWNHTILGLQNLKKLTNNSIGLPKTTSINLKLAVLLHDFGKVSTFVLQDNNYTYYNHPEVSSELSRKFISHLKLTSPFAKQDKLYIDRKKVAFLVARHMLPFNVKATEIKERKIIKYFLEDENLGLELLQLAYIDANSALKAGNKPPNFHSIIQFLHRIQEVKNKLVIPLSALELSVIKRELSKKKYIRLFSQEYVEILYEKIANNQIPNDQDIHCLHEILNQLAKQKRNNPARPILTKLISKKTPYPISGDLIKKLFQQNKKYFSQNLPDSQYAIISDSLNNLHGGKIIGVLKEMFLQDRLDNPTFYNQNNPSLTNKTFKSYLSQKIIDYFSSL